ncbi:TPA: nucleotidyltransferase, partial [Pasteurella multocida]|nr:nucleotidyltransferase [Pasteurella multocida]
MPRTIESALKQLIENDVNMPANRVSKARESRDWLLDTIKKFEREGKYLHFCDKFNLHFGSFARRTKIRPIDDIDLMIGLSGHNLYWIDNICDYKGCSIHLQSGVEPSLWKDCLDDDNSLNSIKLLNIFKSALNNVSHYKSADIHRQQQAVTLELSSYEWNFDLVPCFHTTSDVYLIPNGKGKWMKTDPRRDQ